MYQKTSFNPFLRYLQLLKKQNRLHLTTLLPFKRGSKPNTWELCSRTVLLKLSFKILIFLFCPNEPPMTRLFRGQTLLFRCYRQQVKKTCLNKEKFKLIFQWHHIQTTYFPHHKLTTHTELYTPLKGIKS